MLWGRHSWQLGWPQLLALPLWLLISAAVAWWAPHNREEYAMLIVSVIAVVVVIYSIRALRLIINSREDRASVAEG
jgi:uncharacterized membrane protein